MDHMEQDFLRERLEEALLECSYAYPERVKEDIDRIRTKYKKIHFRVDFHDGIGRKLIQLIFPVSLLNYGKFIHLQSCIWLHYHHPYTPPKCYLIKTLHVDLSSNQHIPEDCYMNLTYANEWSAAQSNLLELMTEIERALWNGSWRETENKLLSLANKTPIKMAQASPPVIYREEVSPLTSGQRYYAVTEETKEVCAMAEEAFRSLTLENIVKTYKLKTTPEEYSGLSSKESINTRSDCALSRLKLSNNYKPCLEEKGKILEELCKANKCCWSTDDIQEAVSSCPDFRSALKYLSHECQICCNQYPYSKFVTMTHCCCSFCVLCFIQYFSTVIKEKSVTHFVCPICKKPDLEKDWTSEITMEYFNLLDIQIRHHLSPMLHELFQSKLRDRTLMQIPNFRWCFHCSFGVLHEADRLRMDCPSCKKSTCYNCKEPWQDQHERISCEEFKQWKTNNLSQYQDERLEEYLTEHGIDCPLCKFRFDLAKGGCLHFKCTQCWFEFCGGCRRPFKNGLVCKLSSDCHGKGLHAHHSRDCFYYLRDWDVERLHHLLQLCGIQYKNHPLQRATKGDPDVLSQPTTEIKEPHMDKAEVGSCSENDYKEFLVRIINANTLDPVEVYTEAEMVIELQRWDLQIPEKHLHESEEAYLQRISMKIKLEIPLRGNHV
ncbi:E3 ubiquitin-protein ligase RNF31-like isoform X2 [Hyperolius riggenbachi]|uniref:E3 ubiquitin-protein ligase RNF31-like isoform X2 n=1 Tax=Hyperolius riggenbachi TaxID=752182 RepID=UPI0035A2D939